MLSTEKAAREKWCPFVRIGMMGTDAAGKAAEINLPAFNRLLKITGEPNEARGSVSTTFCLCIASDCMMWRWGESADTADKDRGRVGFCGLAADWRYS